MARWACCSSSCFVRSAIFLCSSRCSEAERTPVARATCRRGREGDGRVRRGEAREAVVVVV
eukprot:scaffold88415_cov44-Phaeocystis_antarctica.AAC.1